MNIKTITTTDGVNEVDFGSGASRFYWFQNLGTTTVHVSGKADIVAGGDGVAKLAAGDSVCIETLGGKVYVLGAGKVEIHNTGDKFCPFKNAPVAGGGGGVTACNDNLLINPDFKINQRGIVSGNTIANTKYSLDRWRILYNNLDFKKSINITSDGIELVTTNGAGNDYYGDFHQIFENPLPSGYYTMSGKIDGVIRTYTGYLAENADSILFDGVFVLAHTSFAIRFYDDTRKIEWVKLEVGQVATQFVPPDPALELVKCQRFYREIVGQVSANIIIPNATMTYFTIGYMRLSPTVYFKNTMFNANAGARITDNTGVPISGFDFSCTVFDNGRKIEVKATKASHGLDRNSHVFVIDANNPVCVDAEI